jgi:hypothetical protein
MKFIICCTVLSGWESSCCLKFLLGAIEESGKYIGIWANILVCYGTCTPHCSFSPSPIILLLILPPPLLLAVVVIVTVVLIVTTLLHLVCVVMNVILQSHIFSALFFLAEPSALGYPKGLIPSKFNSDVLHVSLLCTFIFTWPYHCGFSYNSFSRGLSPSSLKFHF